MIYIIILGSISCYFDRKRWCGHASVGVGTYIYMENYTDRK